MSDISIQGYHCQPYFKKIKKLLFLHYDNSKNLLIHCVLFILTIIQFNFIINYTK